MATFTAIKTCCTCKVAKRLTEYNIDKQQKDGYARTCKPCRSSNRKKLREAEPDRFNAYAAKYRKANPEKYAGWRYKRKHGISKEEMFQMLEQQGNICKICQTPEPGIKGWVIDHDHKCCGPEKSCSNCKRGILCSPCNVILGFAKDNIQVLARAVEYLEEYGRGK
jgi:hypothetical protein